MALVMASTTSLCTEGSVKGHVCMPFRYKGHLRDALDTYPHAEQNHENVLGQATILFQRGKPGVKET